MQFLVVACDGELDKYSWAQLLALTLREQYFPDLNEAQALGQNGIISMLGKEAWLQITERGDMLEIQAGHTPCEPWKHFSVTVHSSDQELTVQAVRRPGCAPRHGAVARIPLNFLEPGCSVQIEQPQQHLLSGVRPRDVEWAEL